MRPAAREDETVDELRPARMAIKRIGVGGQPLAHLDRGKDRLDHRERPFLRRARRAEIGRAPSELQSLMRISYAVFCLKKKTKQNTHTTQHKIHYYAQHIRS